MEHKVPRLIGGFRLRQSFFFLRAREGRGRGAVRCALGAAVVCVFIVCADCLLTGVVCCLGSVAGSSRGSASYNCPILALPPNSTTRRKEEAHTKHETLVSRLENREPEATAGPAIGLAD